MGNSLPRNPEAYTSMEEKYNKEHSKAKSEALKKKVVGRMSKDDDWTKRVYKGKYIPKTKETEITSHLKGHHTS